MKTVNINLTEIIINNLDGTPFGLPFDFIAKKVGDLLYMHSVSIDDEDLARKIHKGETVEVDLDVITPIINHIETKTPFAPMVTRKVLEYLGDKLQILTTQ
jgi:hypothetical protein